MGNALSEELKNYGITVIHDTTIHDNQNYDKAYYESVKTLDKYLDKYVFDLDFEEYLEKIGKKKLNKLRLKSDR